MFILDDGTNRLPLAFPADPANPGSVRPFEYAYHSLIEQRGQVTITNNVIRPANGETAYLHYVMPSTGQVTVTVFSLSGDIVNVLARGTQAAGEYTTAWDGKNRAGRMVARGIYFIRVVGPRFDEIRKVLVVR
jgi:flagellar hook assembly protein FlgD